MNIASNLAAVRARIARAAGRAGRDPQSIRLVAISKTFPAEAVREAAAAGQIDFGENRLQEALPKMDQTADLPLRWHLVGHLQSNKAKKAGVRFDVIHSVDSADLLSRIDEAAAGHRIDLLVQVDLAREPTKHGAREDDLRPLFAAARELRAARVVGLMLLPPAVDDPDEARPFFRQLRDIRDRLIGGGTDPAMLAELSMGMSHDFEVAVEEGATMVRIGSAIFGSRPPVNG
ncbi:MAG TPA: YggS family pyridoxal phosphate-dependent enzyme [Vicinamibacterales bacterium]|nr:YggS family pyridoxal phosphate-dependent enzyme [Vicinamibacterales bacterium]